ncbi:VOC family protein [Neolewinella litorea]|uniref:VOC family protein n=1 Tax=Neolewinella litorea TaxID=2562452 RepID=A0A4S4NEI9_9BACT|nr:VOC family protein [Neolewinella litorea]THH36528.1 VOC family protein [Neolewinella litorea]
MASVGTYLNFSNQTEEVFNFYKTVFGTEFVGGISRFGEAPPQEGMPPMAEADKNLVMNVQLPITGGHVLMGSDSPSSMGMTVNQGNNVHITLSPDSREETERLFHALSDGGKITMPLQETFWNAYFGMCTDRYGIQWMVNYDL